DDWLDEDCEVFVCLEDGEGNYITDVPLCLVEEIFPDAAIVDCEEIEDPWDDNPFEECDCDDAEYAPVCVADEYGFVFVVENTCVAECYGLEVVGEGDCDYDYGDDFGDEWNEEDCDELVCVVDSEGNYVGEVPVCFVDLFFPGAEIVDCEETDENPGDENNDEEEFDVSDLQDFGDWVYDLTGEFVDHDGGFFIETAYPNPTDDISTLVVRSDDQNVVNLTVVDINGKLMFDQQVVLSNGSMRIELPFNQMPAGMFFVNLIDNNGNQESVRIVNNK
ncbi:MAG: T9SS type A sorting domain-containing protein, partial [Flavobacteriales bacterium]|nr:T9SS type A sorting domain-containing protein [Flavobacteriales bacterium]